MKICLKLCFERSEKLKSLVLGLWPRTIKALSTLLLVTLLLNCLITPALAVTFTAGSATRDAPGPFAGGVMVQGDWNTTSGDSDVVSFLPGTQISGNFYPNWDSNQGSISLWYTPEHSGDSKDHYLLQWSTNGYLKINTSNQLELGVASGVTLTATCALTAGTQVHLAARWDSKKTLDGTNYLSLTVGDTHTFGRTTTYTAEAPAATLYLGSNSSSQSPSNGIIEGLTVYRRPLWDGSYGVNVGNGDEINLIWASSGQDPTLVTGSWDVVFDLPTNSTVGALATTGQAWTHPHASNVLTDGFTQTARASSAWSTDVGTPVTPKSVEFNGTTTSINAGSEASVDDLHDGAFTAEAWVRADGWGSGGYGEFISKHGGGISEGWRIMMYSGTGVRVEVKCATTNALASFTSKPDGRYHHVAFTWDDGGDRKIRIFYDGILSATSGAGVGAVISDAGYNLKIGDGVGQWYFDGGISWSRISNSIRYTTTFIPPSRTNPPANDGNTVRLFKMDEGTGTTITDSSTNAQNATLSNGTWNTVMDTSTDAPGQRIYNWGYGFGVDAANEGIKQTKSSLTAGQNYVLRAPLQYDRASTSWPYIKIYDETNGADIVNFYGPRLSDIHTGADDSATLINSNGHFPQSLVGATLYNITDNSSTTITAISGDMTTVTGVLAGGTDNNWDTNDVYLIVPSVYWVWSEPFTFELPTTARNGVVADCTSISVQVLNANTSGVFYVHQAELLQNLIDNPSLETGAVADPWIPSGWTNRVGAEFDAGDTEQESSIIHSGASSFQINAGGTSGEMIHQTSSPTLSVGSFYMVGLLAYGDGTKGVNCYPHSDSLIPQYRLSSSFVLQATVANWKHLAVVSRAIGTGGALILRGNITVTYADDVYAFALSSLTLTVTPASLTNSTENTDEIRVDGRDTYVETLATDITTTSGKILFNYRPRHSAADSVKFAETTSDDAYVISLIEAGGGTDDYIKVYWDSANTLTMAYSLAGTTASNTWTATGAISANTEYALILQYTGGGSMTLSVDGTTRITLSSIPAAFGTAPNSVYFGSDTAGGNQGDATFSSLVFDNTPPSMALTPLSPDPNNDNTPSVTGTATDITGTITNVKYQMDGTGGSWIACTADDLAFDEASEPFTCTVSPALLDGSHTIYVQATDSNGNTTASGSESSDVFTIDTLAPTVSVTALSPDPNSDNTPTLAGTATDATSVLTAIQYQMDGTGGPWTTCIADDLAIDELSETFTCTPSTLTDGSHTMYVRATDNATNTTALANYATDTFTIDATNPLVSLTALDPDPNKDSTPTLSGSVTDSTGTISAVQFQMDSTSGSWTACTSDDGSFDEASETFTCTASVLADGGHTMYVRSTDNSSNISTPVFDVFVIDSTSPFAFDLDQPSNESYTNQERPIFKWKSVADPTSGLDKYTLEIDNGETGDFSLENIPAFRVSDYETNTYFCTYENFADFDLNNNYISCWTKASSSWGGDNNDGKLKEGKRGWRVRAIDHAGNTKEEARTLYVDKTGPKMEGKINDLVLGSSRTSSSNDNNYSSIRQLAVRSFLTTDQTPTFSGRIIDFLSNQVTSGPGSLEIKLEKETTEGLGNYQLYSLYKLTFNNFSTADDGSKAVDFIYSLAEPLAFGNYKITLTASDKADN